MADMPKDLGALAKAISNFQVEGTEDLHKLTEMLRVFCMDCAQIIDLAEYEIRASLQSFDAGKSRRARAVTRPLRQCQTLFILAARRCVTVYRVYLKQFEDELNRHRNRGGRRFDPQQGGRDARA